MLAAAISVILIDKIKVVLDAAKALYSKLEICIMSSPFLKWRTYRLCDRKSRLLFSRNAWYFAS